MSWIDVGQIAASAIISAGGIGGIIIGTVSFSANKIADRMSKKFQATIDKNMSVKQGLIRSSLYTEN